MSLIERAIDKLGATPSPPPSGGRPAAGATIELAAQRLQAMEPARVPQVSDSDVSVATTEPPITRTAPAAAPSSPAAHSAPPLVIDLALLHSRGFVTPDGKQNAASQEFRLIKRPLVANAFGRGTDPVLNGRRVMVTSSFPGEGKSFCAINLAMSIAAERDHQVLLVDADVAKPSIPANLGISTESGLMDWLADGTLDLGTLVRPTNVDKLSVLSAGRRHGHATEMLASDAMTRLLEELTVRYSDRILIFDSPPLMVTTESRVLASYMGQVVMVVEAGRTPREAVKEALGMLGTDKVVGLVLNKSNDGGAAGYYGYGSYGYGSERG